MKTLVVYSRSSTQRPRSVVASLCSWLIKQGNQVSVLDVSAFSPINQDLPPRWFAKLAGQDVYPGKIQGVFSALGVEYSKLPHPRPADIDVPEFVAAELADAIHSDLVTYFNDDQVDPTRGRAERAHRKMYKTAGPLYAALKAVLQESDYDQVYVPNGRVPEQRMALEAAKNLGIAIKYYEIGRAKPYSFYAGSTQVHDRDGTQNELAQVLKGISPTEINTLAQQWLTARTARNSSINVYSKGWRSPDSSEHTEPRGKKAIFFSSSVDEFASYGEAWALHSWEDQYAAFESIIKLLESEGVRCKLRIHPNLANKSRAYFLREIRRIRQVQALHPNLLVVWHNDPLNSYKLVAESDYVVVGRSTLGLEASLMGKCVWTTTAARYDQVADIRKVFSAEDLTRSNLTLWKVDPHGAARFVAYWSVQDHEFAFGEDTWATWDSLNAPPIMKAGQLLVSNPLSHKVHLLCMQFTRLRNLRFKPSSPITS